MEKYQEFLDALETLIVVTFTSIGLIIAPLATSVINLWTLYEFSVTRVPQSIAVVEVVLAGLLMLAVVYTTTTQGVIWLNEGHLGLATVAIVGFIAYVLAAAAIATLNANIVVRVIVWSLLLAETIIYAVKGLDRYALQGSAYREMREYKVRAEVNQYKKEVRMMNRKRTLAKERELGLNQDEPDEPDELEPVHTGGSPNGSGSRTGSSNGSSGSSNGSKRDYILNLLETDPNLSPTELAALAGTSSQYAGRVKSGKGD